MSVSGVNGSNSSKIMNLTIKIYDIFDLEKPNLAEAWSAFCKAYNRYEDKIVLNLKCDDEKCSL